MTLEIMVQVVDFLHSIPDVIWSGIIASGLTLSGVLISNSSNTKRLRMQLMHDSAEKSRERITGIRREVYLRAADEAHKTIRHFINLPYMNLAETNPSEELHGFHSILSKLKLVAEPSTLSLVAELDAECNELFVRLLMKVQPIQDARTNLIGFEENFAFFKKKAIETFAEIKILSESANPDTLRLDSLIKDHKTYLSIVAAHEQIRNAQQEDLDFLLKAYSNVVYSELAPFGKLLIQIEIEMRGELGLTTDVVAYVAQMDRQQVELGDLLERTLDSMHSSDK
jgi:hypothetical protein